jgi:hypothetical protein
MKHVLFLTPLLFTACATTTQSALLGASIGGGVGVGVGQRESRHFRGSVIGALVGASVGGLAGFLLRKKDEGSPINLSTQVKAEDGAFPPLTKAKLKSMWVPDKIEGNKYIKGHFIYVIEDPGNWATE